MQNSENRRRIGVHRFSPEILKEIRQLSQQTDNYHGFLALAEDAVLILVAIALATVASGDQPVVFSWVYLIAILVIGTRMRAIATLVHEASHWTLFKARWLNQLIGSVVAWTIFQSLLQYRHSHLRHHSELGHPEKDPDYRNYRDQGLFEATPHTFLTDHLWPLLFGLKSVVNFLNLMKDRFLPQSGDKVTVKTLVDYVGFIGFWTAILGLALWFGALKEVLLFWIVPYFTTFQAANWLIEVSEHFPMIQDEQTNVFMTRNRRGSAFESALTGIHGEGWHLIHHLFPGLPYWTLKDAHAVLMQDEAYARANARNGGLFTLGPLGEPTILSSIFEALGQSSDRAADAATQTHKA